MNINSFEELRKVISDLVYQYEELSSTIVGMEIRDGRSSYVYNGEKFVWVSGDKE